MPLDAETRLGPYRIVRLIGVGGMGEVYAARDDRLNRTVALKVLPADRVGSRDRRARFLQEAQLASSLQHPNIVAVYDIGSSPAGEWLAMEFVQGRTLDAILPPGGLPLGAAVRYAAQIADALAAAHGAGIVHRDLKPGNIMVTDQDQVKVLDFGLATIAANTPPAADATSWQPSPVATDAGVILGTVAYMSPEQAEGLEVDARSDLFSFGAILYEMLSGRRAFKADSTPGTIAAVINVDPEPLAQVARHVPRGLDRLVRTCLQKDRDRRVQRAVDVRATLEELREASISGAYRGAAPPRFGGWRRMVPIAGALALLAAAVAAAVRYWPSQTPGTLAFIAAPLTSLPGSEGFPSFSPDGRHVAFAWLREGERSYEVYIQAVGDATARRLTDDDGAHLYPAWSPDGQSIALWHVPVGTTPTTTSTQTRLVLLPAQGGGERTLLEWNGAPRRISWSPDGQWLALSPAAVRSNRERGITLVSPSSGTRVEWATLDPRFAGAAEPVFSPDGRSLAYTRAADDFTSELYLVGIDADGHPDGAPRRIAYGGQEASYPVWTADGRTLLLIDGVPSSNGGVKRVAVDGSGRAQPIGGLEHAASLAVAPPGGRLAFHRPGLDVDIWRLDLANPSASGRLAPSTLWEEGADYSPDGTRLAFSSNRSGAREIWASDLSGDNAQQLTRFGGPVPGWARWSPDGQLIAFDARPSGNSEIFVVPARGGAIRQLTMHAAEDARPCWAPDGKAIYFASTRSGRSEIWRMAADGSGAVQLTRDGGSTVEASPDGRWLFYQRPVVPRIIHRMRPDGTDDGVAIAEDVRVGLYRPTAQGLWFIPSPPPGQASVVLKHIRLADGALREVTTVNFVPISVGLSVSPDERSVVLTRNDPAGSDLLLVDEFR